MFKIFKNFKEFVKSWKTMRGLLLTVRTAHLTSPWPGRTIAVVVGVLCGALDKFFKIL